MLYADSLQLCGFDVIHLDDLDNALQIYTGADLMMIDDDVATSEKLFDTIKSVFFSQTPVPIILLTNNAVPSDVESMLYKVFAKRESVNILTEYAMQYSEQEIYGM